MQQRLRNLPPAQQQEYGTVQQEVRFLPRLDGHTPDPVAVHG